MLLACIVGQIPSFVTLVRLVLEFGKELSITSPTFQVSRFLFGNSTTRPLCCFIYNSYLRLYATVLTNGKTGSNTHHIKNNPVLSAAPYETYNDDSVTPFHR